MDQSSSHSRTRNTSYLGHRKRLREKFLDAAGAGIADYELLEMLLFFAIPRGDTKPLAKQMLNRLKTIQNVIYADDAVIKGFDGAGESTTYTLKLIREIIRRASISNLKTRDVISSFQDVINYCQTSMSNLIVEEFHILFLDTKNHLIADETQQRGTIDRSVVYSREVVKRALELGAASIILVHNHPSGDPEPSTNDILITTSIAKACGVLNIKLLDHIIIGKYQHRSMKSMGII